MTSHHNENAAPLRPGMKRAPALLLALTLTLGATSAPAYAAHGGGGRGGGGHSSGGHGGGDRGGGYHGAGYRGGGYRGGSGWGGGYYRDSPLVYGAPYCAPPLVYALSGGYAPC
jgi:uncharacterized membrane protein